MDSSQPEGQSSWILRKKEKKGGMEIWGDAQHGAARARTGSFFCLYSFFIFFFSTLVYDSVHCITLHYICRLAASDGLQA